MFAKVIAMFVACCSCGIAAGYIATWMSSEIADGNEQATAVFVVLFLISCLGLVALAHGVVSRHRRVDKNERRLVHR
jgi:hypothetical protein